MTSSSAVAAAIPGLAAGLDPRPPDHGHGQERGRAGSHGQALGDSTDYAHTNTTAEDDSVSSIVPFSQPGSLPTAQGQSEESSARRPGSKVNEAAHENLVHIKNEEALLSDAHQELQPVNRVYSEADRNRDPNSAKEESEPQSAQSPTDSTAKDQSGSQKSAAVSQDTCAAQAADSSTIKLEPHQQPERSPPLNQALPDKATENPSGSAALSMPGTGGAKKLNESTKPAAEDSQRPISATQPDRKHDGDPVKMDYSNPNENAFDVTGGQLPMFGESSFLAGTNANPQTLDALFAKGSGVYPGLTTEMMSFANFPQPAEFAPGLGHPRPLMTVAPSSLTFDIDPPSLRDQGRGQNAEDDDADHLRSFARLEFADSTFRMNTYGVVLGRDQAAIDHSLKMAELQEQFEADCMKADREGRSRPSEPRAPKSIVSHKGGILGPEYSRSDAQVPANKSDSPSKEASTGAEKAFPAEEQGEAVIHGREYHSTPGAVAVDTKALRVNPEAVVFLPIHSPGEHTHKRSKAISRKHLKISYNRQRGVFEATALGRNGIFIDDNFLAPHKTVVLRSGDFVQVKDVHFVFVITGLEKGQTGGERLHEQPATGGKTMSFDFAPRRQGHMRDTSSLSSIDPKEIQDVEMDDADEAPAAPKANAKTKAKSRAEAPDVPAKSVEMVNADREDAPDDTNRQVTSGSETAAQQHHSDGDIQMEDTMADDDAQMAAAAAALAGASNDESRQPTAEGSPDTRIPVPMSLPAIPLGITTVEELRQYHEQHSGGEPRKRGPGRPPKNGYMSKREEREFKKLLQEQQRMETAHQQPAEPPLKRKVGRPRKNPLPEGMEESAAKRPRTDGQEPEYGDAGSDNDMPSSNPKKPSKVARPKTPPLELNREDYTDEQLIKPSENYAQLIDQAFMGAHPDGLSLKQIYKRIASRWPYFHFCAGTKGWESSVRHNLLGNACFVKNKASDLWTRVPGMSLEEGKKKGKPDGPEQSAGMQPGSTPMSTGQGGSLHGQLPPSGYHHPPGALGQHQMPQNYQTHYPQMAQPGQAQPTQVHQQPLASQQYQTGALSGSGPPGVTQTNGHQQLLQQPQQIPQQTQRPQQTMSAQASYNSAHGQPNQPGQGVPGFTQGSMPQTGVSGHSTVENHGTLEQVRAVGYSPHNPASAAQHVHAASKAPASGSAQPPNGQTAPSPSDSQRRGAVNPLIVARLSKLREQIATGLRAARTPDPDAIIWCALDRLAGLRDETIPPEIPANLVSTCYKGFANIVLPNQPPLIDPGTLAAVLGFREKSHELLRGKFSEPQRTTLLHSVIFRELGLATESRVNFPAGNLEAVLLNGLHSLLGGGRRQSTHRLASATPAPSAASPPAPALAAQPAAVSMPRAAENPTPAAAPAPSSVSVHAPVVSATTVPQQQTQAPAQPVQPVAPQAQSATPAPAPQPAQTTQTPTNTQASPAPQLKAATPASPVLSKPASVPPSGQPQIQATTGRPDTTASQSAAPTPVVQQPPPPNQAPVMSTAPAATAATPQIASPVPTPAQTQTQMQAKPQEQSPVRHSAPE
ncbi:Forkhead box protein J2 [Emericellopsis cladophorae]|uniref:Forkhead box protein J2 n=1 Tax=Emericellopsis cladophorae TaxID=2686198 RepID=A0A9P9Y289_9HYPO|nr:Forkhead box protein J2 [Emericellopsis cladophorae]KAI6782020.1 Forkhead box protein J2 [Emericellopsis cladophorae]